MSKHNIAKYLITSILTGVCLISCASNELPAQSDPSITGGYSAQLTFNYVTDSGISYLNPKVGTIVNVAKQNPSAIAIIRFNDIAAKDFSEQLQTILNKEGVKTNLIGYANRNKKNEVSVYLKFLPLDQVLKKQQRESEIKAMTNITGIINNEKN